jgi:hypothetical protein
MHAVSDMQAPYNLGGATHDVNFYVDFAVGRMSTLGRKDASDAGSGSVRQLDSCWYITWVVELILATGKEHAMCMRTV